MSDKYFLDTNIFVYSFDNDNPSKKRIADRLISSGLSDGIAAVSYQVVQEFINVATRKFTSPLSIDDCRLYTEKILLPMWVVYPGRELILSALDISERWQYSFYDSLIIAAAIESGCPILYSEDLQHGQKIYSVEIMNPFV